MLISIDSAASAPSTQTETPAITDDRNTPTENSNEVPLPVSGANYQALKAAVVAAAWEDIESKCYYHGHKCRYMFLPTPNSSFIALNEVGVIRILKIKISELSRDSGLDEKTYRRFVDECVCSLITTIQSRNCVFFTGAVAGYDLGRVVPEKGYPILVVASPNRIRAEEGDCSTILGLIERMFGGDGEGRVQVSYLLSYLRNSVKEFDAGTNNPGHCLVLYGPAGTGKTFVLDKIIVKLLGGRKGQAFRFISGGTGFNADLLQSEVLAVDDEFNGDAKNAGKLEANIKQITATRTHRIEAKGVDAAYLSPFWRLVLCVNDTPRGMSVLPLVDESIADKVAFLRVNNQVPFPEDPDEKRAIIEAIERELPAFKNFILNYNDDSLPRDARYGIRAYQNPEVLELLGRNDYERFLGLLRAAISGHALNSPRSFQGTAAEIQLAVTSALEPAQQSALRNILNSRGGDGFAMMLGYTFRKYPNDIIQKRGRSMWRIGRVDLSGESTPPDPQDPHDVEVEETLNPVSI